MLCDREGGAVLPCPGFYDELFFVLIGEPLPTSFLDASFRIKFETKPMCGIVGEVGPQACNKVLLRRMIGMLTHRGPDESGLLTAEGVAEKF